MRGPVPEEKVGGPDDTVSVDSRSPPSLRVIGGLSDFPFLRPCPKR